MRRRHFLSWLTFSSILTVLPSALSSCGKQQAVSNSNVPPSPSPRQDGFIEVGTVQTLETDGSLAFKSADGKDVTVIQDPKIAGAFLALDSLCTHQACNLNWDSDSTSFFCPCHGSKFDTEGNVLDGPATEPIKSYPTKVEEGNILISIS